MSELIKKDDNLPVSGYAEYAEHGDALTADEVRLPYLRILQSNSDEVQKDVEGAKAGRFINTVTKEIMTTVPFVLVKVEKKFLEWAPKEAGGGLVGVHEPESQLVQDALAYLKETGGKIKELAHNGNQLQETHNLYGLILNDEGTEVRTFAVFSVRKTGLKPKGEWMNRLNMANAAICRQSKLRAGSLPWYIFKSKLTTKFVEGDGNKWHAPVFSPFGTTSYTDPSNLNAPDSDVLAEARNLRSMIDSGIAKIDEKAMADDHRGAAAAGETDTEVPF